ncbi:MFS transporter [Paenibacillus alkalitolerans]|uniref:MFS transporter n=1 Tax=Paenibacillus alkalitolerans TaxID=2799335 RepID=UPI0018F5C27D|nr:MFS transporter [Paenibacillus alkalitolerans]
MKKRSERNEFLRVILTLGTGAILVVSLMYVSIPLFAVWGREFQTVTEHTVWAGSAFGFAYAVGNAVFGLVSDRFHRKSILGIGLAFLALSTLAVGWSPSLTWLIGWRAVQGLAAASFPTVALAYIGDVLSPRYRPIAISVLSSSFLMSGILGQLYAQAVVGWLGWRGVFEILTVSYLALFYFVYRLPAGLRPQADNSLAQVFGRTVKLAASPSLLLTFSVSATLLFSFVSMYSGLGPYVSDRFHLPEQGLMWLRIAGILGILMSLAAGPLIGRFGAKRVFIAGLAAAVIGLGGEALSESLVFLVAASVVFVSGIAIANPSIIVIIGQLGGESRGSAFALNACFVFVGASFGPVLAEHVESFAFLCGVLMTILFIATVIAGLRISSGHLSSSKGNPIIFKREQCPD